MYVVDITSNLSKIYKTSNKKIKDYLINNNIPLLSQDDGFFYFSETNLLKKILQKAPL